MDAYESLSLDTDDHRWAFGAAFTDPLDGVDVSIPQGMDAAELAAQCLMLGDDALVHSHRLQQWITRLPELEEETAVANIALDLLGQARLLLARAGTVLGRTEDELAFLRTPGEFRNVLLVEAPDRDFAELVGRLLIVSTWRLATFERLRGSGDPVLAAIAAKAVPELAYHRDYAAGWVVRLGDGTAESARRMQAALERLWPLVDELFEVGPADRAQVDAVLDTVFALARLARPRITVGAAAVGDDDREGREGREGRDGRSGRDGRHTPALEQLVAELQSVARAHPGATW